MSPGSPGPAPLGRLAPALDDEPPHLGTERAPPGRRVGCAPGRAQLAPRLGRDLGERRVVRGEVTLQLLPHRAGQRGARPARGHGHGQVAAPHERRQDERAIRRVVGRVDPHAAGASLAGQRRVDVTRVRRGERQIEARQIPVAVAPRLVTEPPLGGQRGERRRERRRDHRDDRARLEEPGDAPLGDHSPAHDEAAPARELEAHGEMAHVSHRPRAAGPRATRRARQPRRARRRGARVGRRRCGARRSA